MAKRAKTDGAPFNPVTNTLVHVVTEQQPRIMTRYQNCSAAVSFLTGEKCLLLPPSVERDLNTFRLEAGAALEPASPARPSPADGHCPLQARAGDILHEARQTPGLHQPANIY